MGIAPPAQDERRGTDRRGLAIIDGGHVEPESQVVAAVAAAIELGSDMNAVNPAGETAVHIAALQGYNDVVKLLAERGADINQRNGRGLTPLAAVSGRSNRATTAALLRSLGASE
jgi:ankyrin repeat protein